MTREITVERDGNVYLISLGNKQKIETTWAHEESELKEWLGQVQKMYAKKTKGPLFVGLSAERSTNYANGKDHWTKEKTREQPYELLQLCVGNHCLLWEFHQKNWPWKNKDIRIMEQPKPLKDFLCSSQTTIVGVGINKVVEKLHKDTDLVITNVVELRDLAEDKLGDNTNKGQFAKHKVESLAKVVLGYEVVEVIRPTKIAWVVHLFHGDRYCDSVLSDDLVKYTSIEVFLAAQMGSKLSLKG